MCPKHAYPSAEAWLEWFEATKLPSCRAYLCTAGGLEPADADVVINHARLEVFLHWATIEYPVAYFWQTLRNAMAAHRHWLVREQHRQEAYTTWWRWQTHLRAATTRQITDVLAAASPRQRQLLLWFVLGYDDTQVAAWLKTTPEAIRVRRHAAYRTLRAGAVPQPPPRRRAQRAAGSVTQERLSSYGAPPAEVDHPSFVDRELTEASAS